MNKLFIVAVLIIAGWLVLQYTGVTQSLFADSAQPRQDHNRVEVQLHKVRMALHQYNTDLGEIPTGFSDIVNYGLLQWSDLKDPWGHEFAYRSEKKSTSTPLHEEYEIFVYSIGPDGIQDNQDDIYI